MSQNAKKISVLVLGKMAESACQHLARFADFEEVDREQPLDSRTMIQNLKGKDAVISEPLDAITPEVMDACPTLKVVANRAVGYDNIDTSEASKRGVVVTNTPGVLDNATADLAFALLLSVSRRICEADRYVRAGEWNGFKSDLMLGPDLYAKTCGIIGMGRIGKAFAMRARAFGLNIIYTRSSQPDDLDRQLSEHFGATRVEFDELLKKSDFISLHCPLNAQTRHLIGERELNLMKPTCILINTARGAVIDQPALVSHLVQGKILGAGLDVFENEPSVPEPLLKLETVVLTPHIGSACIDTRRRMAEMAVHSIEKAYSGAKPEHLVNPDAWQRFTQDTLKTTQIR